MATTIANDAASSGNRIVKRQYSPFHIPKKTIDAVLAECEGAGKMTFLDTNILIDNTDRSQASLRYHKLKELQTKKGVYANGLVLSEMLRNPAIRDEAVEYLKDHKGMISLFINPYDKILNRDVLDIPFQYREGVRNVRDLLENEYGCASDEACQELGDRAGYMFTHAGNETQAREAKFRYFMSAVKEAANQVVLHQENNKDQENIFCDAYHLAMALFMGSEGDAQGLSPNIHVISNDGDLMKIFEQIYETPSYEERLETPLGEALDDATMTIKKFYSG